MGWAPISELSKYLRVEETLNPEYEKNPLLYLKFFVDNYIVVHAKVISLGEAYQEHSIYRFNINNNFSCSWNNCFISNKSFKYI
jgi:hypothetical protein